MSRVLARLWSEQGQSPWLDNLQRGYLTSGALADLIASGVRGLTSNPTIFQRAIQGSDAYDAQFADAVARGLAPIEAYWEMVETDIRGALDLFAPLHRASGGTDGFVSVEVDPSLAHDGEGTFVAARELAARIDRPNVMIKIPATREGLPAIRRLVAEGHHVNVTLIFGLERHEEVMRAHMAGLEDRVAAGLPIEGIQSVASFFISRVDNEIDGMLDSIGTPEALALRGTAAVSQAVLAYESFLRHHSGPRWEALEASGASVQRPLWASTSTKNPSYPDTKYVDSLIGPLTVNTLPDATLAAFVDHGTLARTIDADLHGARHRWAALASLGIDVSAVADKLEREGVASFRESFTDLIEALAVKSATL